MVKKTPRKFAAACCSCVDPRVADRIDELLEDYRVMPYCSILRYSVARPMPSSRAASGTFPLGPVQSLADQPPFPIFEFAATPVRRDATPRRPRSPTSIRSPSASTTALSITLRSCRTLPGH